MKPSVSIWLTPAANAVRDYFMAQLPAHDVRDLERCCNAALMAVMALGLRERPPRRAHSTTMTSLFRAL